MDAPMPLDFALKRFFPHGGVTKQHMLAAIHKGALAAEKIGRAYFVTAGDIREWRKSCRVENCPRGSASGNAKGESPDVSLSMEARKSTLAAALAITQKLKRNSENTLPKRARSTRPAGIQLRLVART